LNLAPDGIREEKTMVMLEYRDVQEGSRKDGRKTCLKR